MTCHCFDNLLAKPYSGVPSELNAERERDFKDKKKWKELWFYENKSTKSEDWYSSYIGKSQVTTDTVDSGSQTVVGVPIVVSELNGKPQHWV